jgi:hypothetical protein
MSQVEAPYEEMKQMVIDEIEKHRIMYLATSEGEYVTVRRMGLVSDGLRMWFVTDQESRKYQHMKSNPNIALACGEYLQIEGKAIFKGHPMDSQNLDYINVFRHQNPGMFERVVRPGRNLQRKGTRLVEVKPVRLSLTVFKVEWDLEPDFQPYTLILNTEKETAYKLYGTKENITDHYKTKAYKE